MVSVWVSSVMMLLVAAIAFAAGWSCRRSYGHRTEQARWDQAWNAGWHANNPRSSRR